MNSVEEIKAAAAKLKPQEQVELFRWWVESPAFKERQLEALKRDIAIGVADLEAGRHQTYAGENAMKLAEGVSRSGRARLEQERKTPKR